MESPTFCQRGEPGLSPAFKFSLQKAQNNSNKEPSFDKSDSSPKQENKNNDGAKQNKEKNKKIVNMLEEYRNKKLQTKPSLNLMTSITTINEGTVRSKTGFPGSESIVLEKNSSLIMI